MKLYIDIETRSRIDLRKTGVYRYVRCPDWRILMASWAIDDGPVTTALTYDEINDIPGLWTPAPKVIRVAHNAQFERVSFSEFRGRLRRQMGCLCGGPSKEDPWDKCNNECGFGETPPRYLPPNDWHDTQAIAAEWGYSKGLSALAKQLGGEQKDEAGTRLINLFSKPNRKGGWNGPDTHPMEWLEFIAYCEQDVETLRSVDQQLPDWPTEMERAVFLADQAINDRGIQIDTALAQEAVKAGSENAAQQTARVTELSGVENPNSVPQMGAWLKSVGIKAPNLRAETVEKLLQGDLPADHREVLELRQELALAAPKKFEAALGACLEDGKLRGTLAFFGAHTGRWAGRGTQVQNLPRAAFKTDAETEAAILDLMMGLGGSSETLKKLVRPLFTGPFTVVDYSAIEARVIAWLAGEEWALEAFRAGRDIYVETGERMGGLSRAQGKIAVLALGYNGAAGSLRNMSGGADFLIDDETGEITSDGTGRRMTDKELLSHFVYPWRAANSRIVKLWKNLEIGFRRGGPVGKHLSFEKDGHDRYLRLPSGRVIGYHDCGITRSADGYERLWFRSPQGFRTDTYGGSLAENATQAVARDILAEALVRLEENGYRVAAHVHDEILVEGEHDVEQIKSIMTELPSWAYGLPIDGEGFTCRRYKKG